MTFIMIDDESLARDRLKRMIEQLPFEMEFLGEAENVKDGFKLIQKTKPELIFLDIQMPQLSGFDLLDLLPEDFESHIVFVTAYDEYALKAFEAQAIDYLLKPVKQNRLQKSVEHVLKLRSEVHSGNSTYQPLLNELNKPLQRLAIQFKQETLLIPIDDIAWIESKDGTTFVHTHDEKKYRSNRTLDDLDSRLATFFRIHRSYMVSLNYIAKIVPWFNGSIKIELQNGIQLDVAKRRVSELKKALDI